MQFLINSSKRNNIVKNPRDDSGEVPPVPIPNTEVKLTCADGTCLETDRENRESRGFFMLGLDCYIINNLFLLLVFSIYLW